MLPSPPPLARGVCDGCLTPLPFQLAAFAYRDYLSFGYVYVGLQGTEALSSQYNINVYTPTMMVFKEHIEKPADVIQVGSHGAACVGPGLNTPLGVGEGIPPSICLSSPSSECTVSVFPFSRFGGAVSLLLSCWDWRGLRGPGVNFYLKVKNEKVTSRLPVSRQDKCTLPLRDWQAMV